MPHCNEPANAATDALAGLAPEHPYLYLRRADLPDLRARVEASPALRAISAGLRETADGILQADLPVPKPDVRHTILATSRRVLSNVQTLGMMYLLTGDGRYAERGRDEMLNAAGFEDWSTGHFLDTAELCHAVGVGYDWLYDALSETDRRTIAAALVEKGLEQHLAGGWWSRCDHNWNQVCNGGAGVGALAVAHEHPELAARVLRRAVEDMPVALVRYGRDGGWAEGPMYWGYATMYTVAFYACLESALGHDFGLSEIAGFSKCGDFCVHTAGPTGRTFNFADAHGRVHSQPTMFWLARRFGRPDWAAWQREHCGSGGVMDLLWYVAADEMPAADGPPLDALFADTNVAAMRSGWGSDAVFVGFKGGDNRANHGHLDLGSFVLDAGGVRWATDLGGERYSLPDYFGSKRWDYFRCRTEGHNVFTLGGANQDPQACAEITAFRSSPGLAFAVCDLNEAYAGQAEAARRGVALIGRSTVLVQDEITAHEGSRAVEWSFITEAKVELDGPTAALSLDGRTLTVRALSPAGARFEVRSTTPPEPADPNEGTCRVVLRAEVPPEGLTIAVSFAQADGDPPPVVPLHEWGEGAPPPG